MNCRASVQNCSLNASYPPGDVPARKIPLEHVRNRPIGSFDDDGFSCQRLHRCTAPYNRRRFPQISLGCSSRRAYIQSTACSDLLGAGV
jgi:hypothetical protein